MRRRAHEEKIMDWKKILYWAAGAAVLVLLILYGFNMANKGKVGSDESMATYDNLMSKYGSDVEYSSYDGGTASGSEVIDLIKSGIVDGVNVTVINGENQKTGATIKFVTYSAASSDEEISKIYNKNIGTSYINPKANFSSSVTRDANGIIDSVVFKQK